MQFVAICGHSKFLSVELIEEFNPKSMSPLRCIAESDDKVPKKLHIL